MSFKEFYVVQRVIDDLLSTRKRPTRLLKQLIDLPEPKDFFVCKKLNILELSQFCEILYIRISKRLVIERLNVLKYNLVGINETFKLPVIYLQNIANFIEDHKFVLTDLEYCHDLEHIMKFY